MIDIRFVAGLESFAPAADWVRRAGLGRRLAVVQDTSVEGVPDMVLDAALWRTLVDFVQGFDPAGEVSIATSEKQIDRAELSLDAFLAEPGPADAEDWAPPHAVLLRAEGALKLCMITEAWWQVGGPAPYHDSCTYSIFAGHDLTESLPAFLRAAAGAQRWTIDPAVISASDAPPPSWLERLWRRLL